MTLEETVKAESKPALVTVPEVKVETGSKIRIEYQGVNIWDLGSGSYTLPELELTQGANTVTLTGNGTVTFTYQEGDL